MPFMIVQPFKIQHTQQIQIQKRRREKMQPGPKTSEKQISKLQKQIADFQKQLTIQTKQQDLIKNYKMIEGNYQILISIYQASDLMPRGTDFWLFKTNKTACDAFVEIQIRDQIQRTSVKKDTNNPIFDEKFYFKFSDVTLEDLDRSTISFKLYDKKRFILRDSLIGSFQLDWTNVYFKRNHQIYRGWLTLMDPFDEEEGIMGYLMVSVAVLGPNDKVTVHDSAFIKDPMTTIEDTITMPKLQLIDYGINIQIYRAENLIPLDEFAGNVDAYVIAKFSGNKVDTSVKTSCNPQWDQLIRIGTSVPTKSKYIILQVRNRNYMFGDDIIGVIKIPFVDLKTQSQPRWGHLYGPPVTGKDIEPYNFATKMQMYGQEVGSHYRGRLLYKITGQKDIINKNSRSKISFKFPFKPTPVVPLKSYTLRLQVLDGFNLPQIKDKKECYIHCCMGQYMLVSRSFGQLKNHSASFYERMPDKKVQFPEDITQIPDLIIYLAKGEKQKDRISFVRIPASKIINSNNTNPMAIHNLKADLTLKNFNKDESGGSITARAHLFTGQPPQTKDNLVYQFGKKAQFLLKIFVYRARNLPPMNQTGDCDPKLVFHFCGAQRQISQNSTYNPIWNEVIDLEIDTQDFMNINIEKALICNVYDIEENARDNLIGNFMIKLSKIQKRRFKGYRKKFDVLYQKPQWYPIINEKVDIGDPCFGHVLVGCAVFRKSDLSEFNHREIRMKKQICQQKDFQLYLLGARGLEAAKQYLHNKQLFFEIRVGNQEPQRSKPVDVKQHSANFNEMVCFTKIDLPKNKGIVPYVQIKLFETTSSSKKNTFIGFSSISLYDLVPKIQANEKQDHEENSEDTLIDIDQLDQQINIVRERKRLRMEMLNGGNKEEKKETSVQYLPVPKEILGSTNDESEYRNDKLDELLSAAQQQYQPDPEQLEYIKRLQQQRDRQTYIKRQSILRPPRSQNIFQREQHLQDQQQSLNNENTHKQFRMGSKQPSLKFPSDQNMLLNILVPKQGLIKKQEHEQRATSSNFNPTHHDNQSNFIMDSNNQNSFADTVRQVSYVNGEDCIRDNYIDLKNRYQFDSDVMRKVISQSDKNVKVNFDNKTISNFDIDVNSDIPEVQHDERAIKYKDLQRIIKEEEKFTKQAMERQQNYKYAAAVKLSLFKWKRSKGNVEKQTYQDYDTDPEESLDIIPEWYKGRKILATDFEELVPNQKIRSLNIYQGGDRIANLDIRQKKTVGQLKCIGLVIEQDSPEEKQKQYTRLLKPKSYVCRIYILKGKSLISSFSKKPTTYLRISCKGQVFDLKRTTLKTEDYNPEFYICQQIPMEIPGPSTVKIQVMEEVSTFGISQSKVLGYTQIDVQTRHFTKKWHLFTEKKPIQLRNLYSQYGNGTQGRLQIWTDIIQKKNWLTNPPFKIHPPPFDKYELRVIVWSTKECVFKNEAFQSNDVFVRGFLGTSQAQQTDTHWACRGVGNFNYRYKFQVSYPPKPEDMYSDQFIIQIWDRDVVGYNNLIGEKRINLNKIHRIIEKVVKRKKPVKAKMKIREKGLALTQKFWFDVYNHKVKDQFGQLQSQGKVQLSFELVPKQSADTNLKNGFGRAEPNIFPTLPEPAGRLNFNILHPLDFFKQLFGPDLYSSICHKMLCCFILILIGLLLYFVGGSLITAAMVRSASTTNTNSTNNNNSTNK